MKMMFRDNDRVYEIEVNKESIVIEDKAMSEKLTMSRHGFAGFLEWMSAEMKPRVTRKEIGEFDIWDLSSFDE